MKLKTTDKEKIKKHKCSNKWCNKKAEGMINMKFYCEPCYDKIKPHKEERGFNRDSPWFQNN